MNLKNHQAHSKDFQALISTIRLVPHLCGSLPPVVPATTTQNKTDTILRARKNVGFYSIYLSYQKRGFYMFSLRTWKVMKMWLLEAEPGGDHNTDNDTVMLKPPGLGAAKILSTGSQLIHFSISSSREKQWHDMKISQ